MCECSAESHNREGCAGVMGHVTREQALVCLQNCPLLADLAEWSHWDVVFRPELRDLKDFIQKHGGVYQCTALGKDVISTQSPKQEAQLSQRDCATLYVIEYFAKSLKVIRNDTVAWGVCKILLVFQ